MLPDFGVYVSQDGGATWKDTSYPLQQVSALAARGSSIAAASVRYDTVSHTYQDEIHLSRDAGSSWHLVNAGILGTGKSLLWVGSQLLAATTSGVFRLRYGDSVWYPINEGLLDSSLTSLTIHRDNLFLVASSGTVWRRPTAEITTDVESNPKLPQRFALEQNYPNPFNPSTSIKYQIPSTNFVTLMVYDVLGREVATLVNEVKQPGTYMAQWDTSGVASGVYFYRMSTGSFVSTKRMLLMK
jgi:hypothetical protein